MAKTHKKIKLALILFAASFSHFSLAQITPLEADKEISSEETPPSSLEKNAMVWSLMPGESVNRLAKLFYPKDKNMQQLFVAKTLYLSRKIQPDLQGNTTFNHLTSVVIPNIKQLSQQSISSVASKNYPDSIRQTPTKSLQNSPIQLVAFELNPKIQFIYDALVKKNEFLKLEINKINAKLAYLEQVFVTLKAEIIRLADSNSATMDSGVNTQLKAQALTDTATVQPMQASQLNANALQNNEAKIIQSKSEPLLIPAASTKSIPVKSTFDSSYLFLSVFNLLLVISCLIGFVLFSRRQAKNQPFPTTSKFVTTKSDEIRKKSLMIKDKLETQKKNRIRKENMPGMSDAFTHSMPGAEERSDTSTINSQTTPETVPEVTISPVKLAIAPEVEANVIAKVTPSVESADQSYDKEEAELLLGQAKIFVQVDRAGYAIRLLKAQIQAAPKASLQHWLYLLDIYRETNQKEEFLQYAKQLHQNFNVMMPLWENTPPQMVIASSLEEFSHITAKVTKLWADCQKEVNSLMQTKAYLDELLTDNRDSQRTGFSMEVFQEIMTLRDLLDEREKSTEEEMEAY
ncbi:MAG TPA: hypothetical protein VES38_01405 [Methylotenera sp.]|nr:hypothetical protein [Methylotenera sp.]